ncbi:MAG: hypothetical protein MPJ24_00630 [Pirellulaceae bacterium]|nr:hypothetical protein [Pirellulaceae bacterium]
MSYRALQKLPFLASAAFCLLFVGCGFTAQMLYIIQGNDIPPKYDLGEQQRVAVICVSGATGFKKNTATENLTQQIEYLLSANVTDIELISQSEINSWLETKGWKQLSPAEYLEVGKALKADQLLVVELENYSIGEDLHFFQGLADYNLFVYDIGQNGKLAFRDEVFDYKYPATVPVATSDMSSRRFEKNFTNTLAVKIASNFYAVDAHEALTRDNLTRPPEN